MRNSQLSSAHLLRFFYAGLLLVIISACSHSPFNKSATLTRLLESQRYDEAIALYPLLEEEKQAEFNLQQIEKDRDSFIRLALKSSRRATAKKQWVEAEYILDDALVKTPNSHSLQTEIAVLRQRMSRLKADYLINIQWLLANQYIERQPLNKKWELVTKDAIPYIHPSLSNKHRRTDLAETLGEHGLGLLKTSPNRAREFLQTASVLSPNERWSDALATINKKERNSAKKVQQQQQMIRELAFSDLQKNFSLHFSQHNYLKAQSSIKHAANVAQTPKEKSWLNSQQRKLNKAIAEKVDAALKRGQISYSKGSIDEAISIWRQALRLAPQNRQLKESLTRANKFKETYESLK